MHDFMFQIFELLFSFKGIKSYECIFDESLVEN